MYESPRSNHQEEHTTSVAKGKNSKTIDVGDRMQIKKE
jgi:hypothetical protein